MTQALSVGDTIIEHDALGIAGASRHAVALSIAKHRPLLSSTVISCNASAMNG